MSADVELNSGNEAAQIARWHRTVGWRITREALMDYMNELAHKQGR